MYQALYRKYRPRTFDEVAGQEHITEALKKQVATGRLSHAYLFIGTRGTGKTTCAKILARAVNCESPVNGNPCGKCAACRGIEEGTVMDVVEIDAASNNSVDSVRALRDEAIFTPASVKKRVYIIDEVHMLSISAFNALLKIIEEPPEHLMFILATTELRKVPATILSRCQRYSFRRIPADVLSRRLDLIAEKEGLTLRPEASALLSRLAEGSFRDGISLLDQCSGAGEIDADTVLSAMGLAGGARTAELLEAVAERDGARALSLFSSLWSDGKDPAALLSDLCVLMRDILILAVAPKGGGELLSGGCDEETLRSFSGRFTEAELLRAMQRVQDALSGLRDNPSPRTAVELCLVSLCDLSLCDGLPELLARVASLEKGAPQAAQIAAAPPARTAPPSPEKTATPEPEKTPVSELRPQGPAAPLKRTEPESFPAPVKKPEPEYTAPPSVTSEPEYPPPPEDEPDYPPPPEDMPPQDYAPKAGKPAAAAEKSPAPAPEAEGPAGGEELPPSGEATWEALAAAMKPKLPVGLQNLLDDPLQITGEFLEGELVLHIAAGFASSMLNKTDILSGFRRLAEALSGSKLNIRVAEMDSTEKIEKRNIDELAKFKGVTFK